MTCWGFLKSADHKPESLVIEAAVVDTAAMKAGQGTPWTSDSFMVPAATRTAKDEPAFQAARMERQPVGA